MPFGDSVLYLIKIEFNKRIFRPNNNLDMQINNISNTHNIKI
jgi:hypothetical protein